MAVTIDRKSVPVRPDVLHVVEAARTPGTPQAEALRRLTGLEPGASEASVLEALLRRAVDDLAAQAEAAGYALLAETWDDDDRTTRTARRARGQQARADA